MKIKNYLLGFTALALAASAGYAQTDQERERIIKDYDQTELQAISQKSRAFFNQRHNQAMDYAKNNNIPTVITNEDGSKSMLHHMDDLGNLIYYKSSSIDGAISIGVDKLWPEGSLGLQLEGEGMLGGVWDGGKVRETHELLSGQVTLSDAANIYESHGTHVAGIMVGKVLEGSGYSNFATVARGMAYKGHALTFDWNDDLGEMAEEASEGLLVSNHSYGLDLSQVNNPLVYIGRYDYTSRMVDNMMYYAPKYMVVTAAGNDRGYGNPNPADGGYNLLGGQMTTAKNDIVVAATGKVLNYTGPNSVPIASFSSWGPTIDNRVKPDIAANGTEVVSSVAYKLVAGTFQPADDGYSADSGTSMAAPSVAGAIMLLQELAADLNDGEYLDSATIKALIIQTARQADNNPGPDPRYGWGLMATDLAAELLIDAHNEGNSFYEVVTLNNSNSSYVRHVKATDNNLKVTMVWNDPAGNVQQGSNPPPVLINDLDMRITDSQGNVFYPWRLGATYTSTAKRDGDNAVDNVEVIEVQNAIAGEVYKIEVTHKGTLTRGKQDFSIVASGTETMGLDSYLLQGLEIYPNPAKDVVNINLQKPGNKVNVAIYDMNGRLVISEKFTGVTTFEESFDISRLNTGIYFVKIDSDGKKISKKLIVK